MPALALLSAAGLKHEIDGFVDLALNRLKRDDTGLPNRRRHRSGHMQVGRSRADHIEARVEPG